jgi:hypothetical protein
MGFQDFVLWTNDPTIPEHHVRCKGCESIIPTGIVRIAEHWNNCTGKGFTEGVTIETLDDFIKELQKQNYNEHEIWAHELLCFSDADFIAFCKSDKTTVIGGSKQMKLIEERLKTLGVEL